MKPIRREQYAVFFAGLLIGVVFFVLWTRLGSNSFNLMPPLGDLNTNNYRIYVIKNDHGKRNVLPGGAFVEVGSAGGSQSSGYHDDARHHFHNANDTGPVENVIGHHVHNDSNDKVARTMYNNVRILCWIMTGPQNHETKARHVKATWAKRCNKFVFVSSQADHTLPSINVNVSEGRDALWGKTKRAYEWCYRNHLNDFDWFLKADDDTYVVVENLRFLLANYSVDEPIYFGKRFKPYVKQGYMSGGAGYVLSREALRRFVEVGLKTPSNVSCKANNDTGAEDAEMGKCLEAVGVKAGDALDEHNRSKFFPFSLEEHLTHKHDPKFWYWNYTMDDEKPGFDCCSDFAVSFHYISPNQMYLYDFLIYHLRPYGIAYEYELPKRIAEFERNKTTANAEALMKTTVSLIAPNVSTVTSVTDTD